MPVVFRSSSAESSHLIEGLLTCWILLGHFFHLSAIVKNFLWAGAVN
jgi:hypothetical protein